MKNFKLLLLAAVLLCAAYSCEKAEAPMSSSEPNKESNLVPLILTTGDDTKTSLVGDQIHWSTDDILAVYDCVPVTNQVTNNEFTIANCNASSASFTGFVQKGTHYIAAVYPYDCAKGCEMDAELKANSDFYQITKLNLKVEIPSPQIAKAGSFAEDHNISIAKTDIDYKYNQPQNPNRNITFKNVCALLNFTLPTKYPDYWIEGDKITSVTISSSVDIVGQMNINYVGDDPVLTGIDSGSDNIIMTGDFALGQTYWFVVAPVKLNGISITVETEQGKVYRRSKSGEVQLNQGTYRSLGTLNFDKMKPIDISAEHTYGTSSSSKILTGTNLTLKLPHTDITEIALTVKHKTKGAVRTFNDVSKINNGVVISDNTDTSWPYLPVGTYTVSGSYTSAVDGKIEIVNNEFLFNEAPQFSVGSYNAYTSWTLFKEGMVDDANKSNGSSIYFSVPESSITIDNKILKNASYNNLISVSFTNSASEVATGVFNAGLSSVLNAPAVGAYSSPTYHFDEVDKSFAATTCSVTGIPHVATPPTKALGWGTPSNTDVVTWQSDKVTLTGAISEPVIQSPKLYLPEAAKVYLYVEADLYSFAAFRVKNLANMVVRSSGKNFIEQEGQVSKLTLGAGNETVTRKPTYTGTGLPTGEFNVEIVNTNRAATTVTVKDFQLKYSK